METVRIIGAFLFGFTAGVLSCCYTIGGLMSSTFYWRLAGRTSIRSAEADIRVIGLTAFIAVGLLAGYMFFLVVPPEMTLGYALFAVILISAMKVNEYVGFTEWPYELHDWYVRRQQKEVA